MACLTRETSKKFLDAIKSGEITPEKMLTATSKERSAILSDIVGPENVSWVNALLESKILLKDQKRGMVTWAKKVAGLKPEARRDLLSRIQKHDRVFNPVSDDKFLASLAEKRFGQEITFEEAKNVSELAKAEQEAKAAIPENAPIKSEERLRYGATVVAFKDYVGNLKLAEGKRSPSWYLKHPFQSITRAAGVSKSLLSTLDNSFFGRQGIKMLFTNPDIWAKGFVKSWGDIGKELAGRDAMASIRADIYSRPNAINGAYERMKLDVGIGTEEAFPSHILTSIPGLGRVAKAAESAFNGAALRFRADYGDRMLAKAAEHGIDITDAKQVEPIGRMVNSMTGRGNIGKLDAFGQQINAAIFSIKFLKSNIDTLTAHQFQKDVTPFVRKEAAMNLTKIVGGLASVYAIADMLQPGSVEKDPRSSLFGKIKVGDTTFDPSGGMGSLVTLAFRMLPTRHNGRWGWYSKTRGGEVIPLGTGKFGSKSPLDIFYDFTEGKFAPYAALLRDIWRGEDYQGNKTYVSEDLRVVPNARTLYKTHAPIPLQNFEETLKNPNAAPLLTTTILDGLGIGANTYTPKPTKKEKGWKTK